MTEIVGSGDVVTVDRDKTVTLDGDIIPPNEVSTEQRNLKNIDTMAAAVLGMSLAMGVGRSIGLGMSDYPIRRDEYSYSPLAIDGPSRWALPKPKAKTAKQTKREKNERKIAANKSARKARAVNRRKGR